MSIDTNAPVAITEADEVAIRAAANRLIAAAAQKGGYSIDRIPEEARQDALNFARNAYVEAQALKSNPLWEQLEAERAAHVIKIHAQRPATQHPSVATGLILTPIISVVRIRKRKTARPLPHIPGHIRCPIRAVTCRAIFTNFRRVIYVAIKVQPIRVR